MGDSEAVVTDQLCATPAWLRYDMLPPKEQHREHPWLSCSQVIPQPSLAARTAQNSPGVSRDGDGRRFIKPVLLLKVLL